jgi:hypothetical protein
MLVIRDHQMQAFRAAGREKLERNLAQHLSKFFPKHTEYLGEKRLRTVVQYGIASARNQGFRTDYETFLYVDLMYMLGCEFDRDPQLPWVSEILALRNGAPLMRIESLHERAMKYFDEVAGINNEHWVRAMVRARDFDLSTVEETAAPSWLEAGERILQKLYPEKFRSQGSDPMRKLMEAGIAAARERGLTRFSEVIAYTSHMYYMGAGFECDPLFPWTAILPDASQGDPAARMRKVHAGTVEYLHFALTL